MVVRASRRAGGAAARRGDYGSSADEAGEAGYRHRRTGMECARDALGVEAMTGVSRRTGPDASGAGTRKKSPARSGAFVTGV
jgi:hypothetical protein